MTNSNLFKVFTAFQLILSFFISFYANADDSQNSRPDSHAPIGVMRDHVHKKGEYMLSYRYEFMRMKGARSNEDNLSSSQVLAKFMMAPRKMDMRMHMVGGMYGVTDNLTLATSGSFIEKDMVMINRSNQESEQEISGFGDVKLNSMYKFFDNNKSTAQFNLGFSIPSGSIKETNDNGTRASYSTQLGSGSYEALPGISYSGFKDSYSYGAQANGAFRLDYNNNNYKLGDSYNLTTWAAKKLNEAFSISSRLDYTITQKTKGFDKTLNTMMSPSNNASFSGSRKVNFLLGANFIVPNGALKGNRLAIEGGVPLYQNLNGIQLKTDYKITAGWQKAF